MTPQVDPAMPNSIVKVMPDLSTNIVQIKLRGRKRTPKAEMV